DPTPTVGTVGLIPNEKMITTSFFKQMNDVIILIGGWGWEIAGTSYCQEIHGLKCGFPPSLDLPTEKRLHDGVRALIAAGLCRSAHDLSDGGLGVALAESIVGAPAGLGASIEVSNDQRLDITLFNESQSRAIVTVRPNAVKEALDLLEKQGVTAQIIGAVSFKPELVFAFGNQKVIWTRAELDAAYEGTIPSLMGPS
ncbi:MAG: AIR synthase-related protein, partial [Verrucomicrobiota bacterium]